VRDRIFPFSAIVGQEAMKLALLLNAIHPGLHGVLIAGARGSAKSTAARSLAALLPTIRSIEGCPMACDPDAPSACCPICSRQQSDGRQDLRITERATPFVSLPLGATEDRVIGAIDLEQALTRANACFEPGVLAKAHRGVLYIDEVNLLPDHLVDLLLDVAATGIHHVEREGVSVTHPARFMLVGTMNPDEGELRPQLLDRFGLSVRVEEFSDPARRSEVVQRALAFETDPESFLATWKGPEEDTRLRLQAARQQLRRVIFPQSLTRRVSELCLEARVEGLRADLVMHRAASALAVWEECEVVTESHVARTAELALAHRRRESPEAPPPRPQRKSPDRDSENQPRALQDQNRSAEGPHGDAQSMEQPPEAPFLLNLSAPVLPSGKRVKRNNLRFPSRGKKATADGRAGPSVRSVLPHGFVTDLALGATLQAAALRRTKSAERRFVIGPTDFREHERRVPESRLFVLVVDASRSMGVGSRLALAKSALLGLLETAYRKRDRVALIACAGAQPILTVPPTRSVRVAQRRLHGLHAGGRTPLAAGLELASQLAERERQRGSHLAISIILLSDGHSNVPHRGLDPLLAVERQLGRLVQHKLEVLLIDAEDNKVPLALMPAWARRWGVKYLRLSELHGRRLTDVIRTYLEAPGCSFLQSDQLTHTRAAS
jgi:magnesium chelatase subunit D